MKTLSFFSLSSLILAGSLAMGCALPSAPTSTEEEESTSTAATTNDDEGAQDRNRTLDLAQPIAPDRGDLGHCTSCGPGPQPWQNDPIHVNSQSR